MLFKEKLISLLKEVDEIKKDLEELRFGCQYQWLSKIYPRIDRVLDYYQEGCGCDERKRAKGEMILAGSAFTNWKCKGCKKTFSYPNTRTPILCLECAKKKEKCPRCGEYFNIIGNPLEERLFYKYCEIKNISKVIIFYLISENMNLSKSFDNQSEEFREKLLNFLQK